VFGSSVNIPWPGKGMGDAEYIYAFQKIVMPIAMEFAPELVISMSNGFVTLPALMTRDIVSAGFDAAVGDTLGECYVSPAGYAHMTHMLAGLAGGRLVVALEVQPTSSLQLLMTDVLHRVDIILTLYLGLLWL
jgi:histone deacetylase 6